MLTRRAFLAAGATGVAMVLDWDLAADRLVLRYKPLGAAALEPVVLPLAPA